MRALRWLLCATVRACTQVNDVSVTLTQRIFPLELLLAQFGFEREGEALIFLPTPDKTIEAAVAYVHDVARTWGWNIITSAPAPA